VNDTQWLNIEIGHQVLDARNYSIFLGERGMSPFKGVVRVESGGVEHESRVCMCLCFCFC
jgi:hypothetical protein